MPTLFDRLNFARHQDAHEYRRNQRWFAVRCGRDGSSTQWSSTLVHPLLIPSMSELEYQYEHAREYSQQEFVKQRGFGMQSAR